MSPILTKLRRVGLSSSSANLLLMTVAMAWGMSYVLMKIGASSLPPFEVLALRFSIASVVCLTIFHRRLKYLTRRTLFYTLLLSIVGFFSCAAVIYGTRFTEASTASFLTSTAIVIVPVAQAVRKRRLPARSTTICTLTATLGIALLSLKDGFALSPGALLCILGAFLYAAFIIMTDEFVHKEDSLLLGVMQLVFNACLGWICAFLFDAPVMPEGTREWGAILGLALICSAFAFVAQPVAQRFTTPERTALILSMEPVWGAVFSFIILSERLSLQASFGAVLVLVSVFFTSFKKNTPS